MKSLRFPRRFVWGAASAAPQIEGAAQADGKGESIWDRFSREPGRVADGDTPAIACDSYHRYPQDIAALRWLGVNHFRLSLAWPRLYPAGDGPLNQKGLDHYDRLIDALLAAGVDPWVTFFHWDLPQALEDRGGWRSRVTVDAFARFADTAVKTLGDRVKHWFTLNEILCFTEQGYNGGPKAPGAQETPAVINQTFHHALLCHGHAVRAVREHGRRGSRVGLADNAWIPIPVTETEPDAAAARRAFVAGNLRVLDPIYRGRYAEAYLKREGAARPRVAKGDFALISLPTDFLALNIYRGHFVRAAARPGWEELPFPPHYPRSDPDWLLHTPQAMYWGPRLAHEVYGVKQIFISENGAGYEDDTVNARGEILDLHRRDYVRNYLRELHRAIQDGVPVKGYFAWTLMDNFEWHDGYAKRFGLFYTDYPTQRRIPKLSAHWYRTVVQENRLV